MDSFSQVLELIKSKLLSWADAVVLTLPNIFLVLLSIVVGIWIIRRARKRVRKISSKISSNVALAQLVYNVIITLLYIALLILVLSILGLSKSVTTILASAGVMGLAVGLALQDPLMNLFSGIIMSVKTSFNIGDFVETNGHIGAVQAISLRSTQIRTLTGEEVNIPNKLVLQNPVKNFTTNGIRRVDIVCGVSYGADLRKVKEIAMSAVEDLAFKEVARPVEFIFTGFGDSAINFQLRFWSNPNNVWEFLEMKSEGIMKIKEAFDKNGINIPFPIRTLDIDLKGGQALKEVLK
jgi:small conductance mechanosensitive channel